MIFTLFAIIVFISELIITLAIVVHLHKFDRMLVGCTEFLDESKPKIQSVSELVKGISEQIAELTPIWVENLRRFRNKLILNKLESLMSMILFWGINVKVAKKLKRTKFIKAAFKGLSMLQNVV